MQPLVSVIIPCRNEEKFIGKCLDSLLQQDYPRERMEILAVNGASEDKTREIIERLSVSHPFIRSLENPKKYTPISLNIGIKEAKGEIIIRMDAHAGYEKDYISKCVKYLKDCKADNVGGVMRTLASKKGLWPESIALVLSHPFGAGNSFFRIGSKRPRWVDTVFGGCYKREVFDRIGFFNERLIRSQDIELNQRLRKAGGKILLVPEIRSCYYPQSDFFGFLKHNFEDGIWTIYPLKFGIKFFSWRHLAPLAMALAAIILTELSFISINFFFLFLSLAALYLFLALALSFRVAVKEKRPALLISLPLVFGNRHFGYGFGSLWGLIKTML